MKVLTVVVMLLAAIPGDGHSQTPPTSVELHAEAVAAGAAFTWIASSAWSFGVDVSVGKHIGVDVAEVSEDLETLVSGYVAVRWTPDTAWQVMLSPIGFAGAAGNDFGTVYPSARLGISHFFSRLGAGTELRVVRLAGGNGTGEYWIEWSPLRVSIRL